MKITDIRLRRMKTIESIGEIDPAWPGPIMTFRRGGGAFTEIEIDDGLVGIGPAVDPDTVTAAKNILVGQNPFHVERHNEKLGLYARGRVYGGIAGYDIALWDLIGKVSGQSLSSIFGGGEQKITPYASLVSLGEPSERADLAKSLVEAGWQAIKLRIHHQTMREDIETVRCVREAVGNSVSLSVDANQAQSPTGWQPGVRWDYLRALHTARELEDLGVLWLEEPLPRHDFDAIGKLNGSTSLAIAGGENNAGVHEFTRMLREHVYDIVQPECMVLGGITPLRKIAGICEAFGRQCIPHHGGGDLGVVAHMHLISTWSNSPFLELLHEPPVGDYRHRFEMFVNPPVVEDGMISIPDKPGLGVEIRPDWIETD